MDFSIIINTHNQSKFLGECIKSCINQNYLNYEIIIVDTSKKPSKDKHIKNKKIKYFHLKENSRKFPVLNQMYQIRYGLKKSKGKYICLLDGDDANHEGFQIITSGEAARISASERTYAQVVQGWA